MKATALLENQHRTLRGLFARLARGWAEPGPLLTDLANQLAAHMAIEQDIFYPSIRDLNEGLVAESFEEHALAEVALKRLLATDPHDPAFQARVTATRELIEHHLEEEQDDLFPQVQRAFGSQRLLVLGQQMQARFDEVVAVGFEASVPRGFSRTSSDVSLNGAGRPRSRRDRVFLAFPPGPSRRPALV